MREEETCEGQGPVRVYRTKPASAQKGRARHQTNTGTKRTMNASVCNKGTEDDERRGRDAGQQRERRGLPPPRSLG